MRTRIFTLSVLLSIMIQSLMAQNVLTIKSSDGSGQDAEIFSSNPDSISGSNNSICPFAQPQDSIQYVVRGLIEFDLSDLPENVTITNAQIALHFNPYHDSLSGHYGVNSMLIRRLISSWTEDSVTWNTLPLISELDSVYVNESDSATQDYDSIDITSMLQNYVDDRSNSYGFIFQLVDEDAYASLVFSSGDHIDSTLHPELRISYTEEADNCLTLIPGSEDGKDAEISFAAPDTNFGQSTTLSPYSSSEDNGGEIIRGLIDFDLSDLPDNVIITDAKLSLYYNPDNDSVDGHNGENELLIQRITSDWIEDSVTWNTQPATTDENQVSVTSSDSITQDYEDIDLTALIQDYADKRSSSYGLLLKLLDEAGDANLIFSSSDYEDESLHPKLVVCYEEITIYSLTLRPDAESGIDAEIKLNLPDENFGDSEMINAYAWTESGVATALRGLIDFDFSEIPDGASISDAKLSLYFDAEYSSLSGHYGTNALQLERITSSWTEEEVTWNTMPSVSEDNVLYVDASSSSTQDYEDLDVTSLIQDYVDNPAESFGFMIGLEDETPYAIVLLASSDHPDSDVHPMLTVSYSGGLKSTRSIPDDSMSNVELEDVMKVYPNPTRSDFQIEIREDIKDAQILIYNMQGQIIKRVNQNGISNITINRESIPFGLYQVCVINNSQVIASERLLIVD